MRVATPVLVMLLVGVAKGVDVSVDCDPCINRESYKIKAIVHGREGQDFWEQVRKAAVQAGKDMRVDLDFPLHAPEASFPEEEMTKEIAKAAAMAASGDPNAPNALVITIPSDSVKDAAREASVDIPIFGMNSGYREAEEAGVLGFVGMDEYLGGVHAAKAFLSKTNVTTALFVNHEIENSALEQRYNGFSDALRDNDPLTKVDEIAVDTRDQGTTFVLREKLVGCPYEAVLLAGHGSFEIAKAAIQANGCALTGTLLGAFDTSFAAFDAIAIGEQAFGISQQQYLQGAFSVVMASVYATSGYTLARSAESEFGVYLSGPSVIDRDNLPSDTRQNCEAQAFPVCGSAVAFDNRTCPCIERSKIRIGGVLHGLTTDKFWDVVFAQAFQAADDLGVELLLDRLEPQPSVEVWARKMARKMVSLCHEGVDGLFVTIPFDGLIEAIQECQELNVPVISINSGAIAAMDLGLPHHISQLETPAGFAAGERLLQYGDIKQAFCFNYEAGNSALAERCEGFLDAVGGQNVSVTDVVVGRDSVTTGVKAVEDAVASSGDWGSDWEGVGVLCSGFGGIETTIALKEKHPGMHIGTFDFSSSVYEALDEGIFKFAVDQGPPAQGYFPVWLLTLFATTQQKLVNTFIESGPIFHERSPTKAEQQCNLNHFEVCPRTNVKYHDNLLSLGITTFAYTVVGLSWGLSIFFIAWTVNNRDRNIVLASQPEFMVLMCIGAIISSSTLVALSFEAGTDESTELASAGCTAVPFLYCGGWVLMFSSLGVKTLRMFKIMKNKREGKQEVVGLESMIWFVILALIVDMALVIAWSLANPLVYVRREISRTVDPFTGMTLVESVGSCAPRDKDGPSFWLFVGPLICFHFILMAATNLLLYRVKDMNDRYQESKYIGFAMVLMLETLVVGLPIASAVGDAQALFVVAIGVIGVHDISVLSLLFVPKILFQSSEKDEEENREEDALVLASLTKVSKSRFGEAVDVLDEVVSSVGLTVKQRQQLRTVKTLLIQRKNENLMHVPSKLYSSSKSNAYILREFGGVSAGETSSSTMTKDVISEHPSSSNVLPEFQALDNDRKRQVYDLLAWTNLKRWDFPVFDLAQLTEGRPLLFMGYGIIGAPHSQYAMAQECGLDVDLNDFEGYNFMDSSLQIPIRPLCNYLRAVEDDYNRENPYHNSTHASDVLQTLHSLIQMKKYQFDDDLETFSILLAAVVHDVKHPGINNAFQINAKTHFALVYNDVSVLENMHCAHAFMLMLGKTNPDGGDGQNLNLLANVSDSRFASIRKNVVEAVLKTDMTKHFALVDAMKGMLEDKDDDDKSMSEDESSRWDLLMFMLHAADISGQAKSDPLFKRWADLCLAEFFSQGDTERLMGLPISPLCDRDTTDQFSSQAGFLTYVVLPTFEVLALSIVNVRERIVPIIRDNLAYWKDKIAEEKHP